MTKADVIAEIADKTGIDKAEVTVAEIRRKAAQIAPAYNKGALQYLPSNSRSDLPKRSEK